MTEQEAIDYFKRHIGLYCCREAEQNAIKALEKQIATKPDYNGENKNSLFLGLIPPYSCKLCGAPVNGLYCHWCGQRLDWSDEE